MSDEELRLRLATVLRRPVSLVSRRVWPYTSSTAIEKLKVAGHPPILFKQLTPLRSRARPSFMVDPLREVEAYTRLLDGFDVPCCYGTVVTEDLVWLFLELLDGVPLWHAEGTEAWEQAARWLAHLHSAPLPRGEHLINYDAQFFERWIDRAYMMSPQRLPDGVRSAARQAIRRLESWHRSLVHGEFYASNVVVEPSSSRSSQLPSRPRIRPVDWETVGIGPGLLDLAALVAGDWEADPRERIVAAYRAAMPTVPADFDAALDAAGLMIALQWLGWSRDWSAPEEHCHDWAADARELARRITS